MAFSFRRWPAFFFSLLVLSSGFQTTRPRKNMMRKLFGSGTDGPIDELFSRDQKAASTSPSPAEVSSSISPAPAALPTPAPPRLSDPPPQPSQESRSFTSVSSGTPSSKSKKLTASSLKEAGNLWQGTMSYMARLDEFRERKIDTSRSAQEIARAAAITGLIGGSIIGSSIYSQAWLIGAAAGSCGVGYAASRVGYHCTSITQNLVVASSMISQHTRMIFAHVLARSLPCSIMIIGSLRVLFVYLSVCSQPSSLVHILYRTTNNRCRRGNSGVIYADRRDDFHCYIGRGCDVLWKSWCLCGTAAE